MKRKLWGTILLALITIMPVNAQQKEEIDKILIIYKTHLDIGFTDLGSKVIDTYNHQFIPSVLDLSKSFKEDSVSGIKYPWTTGSWLIWNYLERSTGEDSRRMEEAIRRGDFGWHAMPFTLQVELCDSSLLSAACSLSEQLDRRFGRKTIAAKITDVPGVTRSIIPLFKKHGISLLHLGANSGAAVAGLPEVFRWRDINGDELNVIYQSDYGKPLRVPGTNTLVVISFTNDNHGPHSKERVKSIYKTLASDYPNAKIIPSSLNDVALAIEKVESSLPVVTSEWGDTWMYGIASDSKKIAEFRQLVRLRNKWIGEGKLVPGSEADINFVVPLLLTTEHTWGIDVKSFLGNYDKYQFDKNPEFLLTEAARFSEKSWNERRAFIWQAIAELPAGLAREAIASFMELTPEKPVFSKQKTCMGKTVETKYFRCSFDSQNGSMNYLVDKRNNKQWADVNHPWGEFAYQIYSGKDFSGFIKSYCPEKPAGWMVADYGKPGLDKLNLENKLENYKVEGITKAEDKKGTSVCVRLSLQAKDDLFGAPREAFVSYFFPNDKPEIEVELSWFDKSKNRIPEAVWFSFVPLLPEAKIYVDKLGTEVDVQDVVYNGARTIHGVTRHVSVLNPEHKLYIQPLDAPLIQFGKRNLLSFDNETVDPGKGMHFCLLNTLWGTNYAQWFGDDMKFRFVLSFD